MAAASAGFHHPLVRAARLLQQKKNREERQCFLLEGHTLVSAALDAGAALECAFFAGPRSKQSSTLAQRIAKLRRPAFDVDQRTMQSLSQTQTPPGVVAVAPFIDRTADELIGLLPRRGPLLLAVLHQTADPGNAGTLVRSCAAFAAAAVCFGPHAVDPYNAKTVRSSMGAIFAVPVVRYESWAHLRSRLARANVEIAAAQAAAPDVRALTIPQRIALVVGHERHGLTGVPAADVALQLGVPQARAVESLNAAVAGSILLYELARSSGLISTVK